jgi:hypothetical protein
MTHKPPAPRIDERLERLLEVERQIERRIRAAEAAGRERVARAREVFERSDGHRAAALEKQAKEQERADLEAHAATLANIAAEADVRTRALDAVPDETVDRLARRALAIAIGGRS